MTTTSIRNNFQQDMRLFELFNKDVQQHISALKQETAGFQAYLDSGASIEVKPTIVKNQMAEHLVPWVSSITRTPERH